MPTMAMQSLNLGGMTRPQTAAACRNRCAVRTMAVVAAPPKTGLKTEISEKVSLFRGIVYASMTAMQNTGSACGVRMASLAAALSSLRMLPAGTA